MSNSDADKTVLAGAYSTKKSHGLIGLPLGSVVPEDEFLHPPAPSGHFASTETSYFGFNIPERKLNGEIYMWFHPLLKVMSASVYIWTGIKKSTLACEYINHHHYLPWPANGIADYHIEALGLHIRVIEPLKSVQIDFEDKVRNVSFSIRHEAIMPPGVRPGGFHITQAMKVTGDLNLFGEKMNIDELVGREEQKITNDIMYHIREFFLISSRRNFTKKSRGKMGKYSRKKHAVSRI